MHIFSVPLRNYHGARGLLRYPPSPLCDYNATKEPSETSVSNYASSSSTLVCVSTRYPQYGTKELRP